MNNRIEFFPINWVQGMGVSPSHFIASENYLLERLLQSISASQQAFQYGLLPQKEGQGIVKLSISGQGEYAKVNLDSYAGITPGGCLVLIDEDEKRDKVSCPCNLDGEAPDEGWDIILSVSPYDRNPYGVPDIKETPPRYPYVVPTYRLSLVPRLTSNAGNYGPFSVIVGILRKKDTNYSLDGNYIPPALTMSSHSELYSYMTDFSKRIAIIDSSLHKIADKALAQTNRTSVADSVLLICRELLRTTSSIFFKWRNCAYTLSPYQITEILTGFASSILTGLCFLSKKDKEEMLKYFHEWNGIAPSTFEQLLDEVVHKPYNHNRINQSMIAIQGVIRTLEELFLSLSRLEFVGQHKESIVISERQIRDTSSNNNNWTLVD